MTRAGTAVPFLPFAKPSITDVERDAVMAVLESGWLTTGPKAHEFEERFAEFVGVPYALALNSATAALHLAVEALGVQEGDEVIVPTWTFAATAEVVVYRRATPVFVDVDPTTLNMTPELAGAAVTPRTKAVMAVHIAGRPMEIQRLVEELEPRGCAVIEDSAHAFPSRIAGAGGRMAGTIGRVGAYSFYATKTITTGEGGMFVTRDAALVDRARQMSLHGISRDAWKRYTAAGSWFYEIEDAGYKYNMTDLAAALGIAQLSRADELLEARRRLAADYRRAFTGSAVADLIELPPDAPDESHAWHLFIVRLHLDRIRVDRAAVVDALRDHGIGASVHFIPLHLQPFYRDRFNARAEDFPVATREYWRVISLPIWPGMTDDDVSRVVTAFEEILDPNRR